MKSRSRAWWVVLATMVWLIGVGAGVAGLISYAATPGSTGQTMGQWPRTVRIKHPGDRMVLLMFAHPRCPCSRASVRELALLVANARHDLQVHIEFFLPDGAGQDWMEGDLVRSAKAISGAAVEWDSNGEEAKLFGVTTSGHVLLYDKHGQAVFSGGITGARGHEGANPGADAVGAWLAGKRDQASRHPVFGCEIVTNQGFDKEGSCHGNSDGDSACCRETSRR